MVNFTPEEQKYNDDSLLLEGLYEFHPDYFDDLSFEELSILKKYYLTGCQMPSNVFKYRLKTITKDPSIQEKAQKILEKIKLSAGID